MSKNETYIILSGIAVVGAYFVFSGAGALANAAKNAPGQALSAGGQFIQGAANKAQDAAGNWIDPGAAGDFFEGILD